MRRVLIAVLLAATLAACGGGDDGEGAGARGGAANGDATEDSGAGAAAGGGPRAGGQPGGPAGGGSTGPGVTNPGGGGAQPGPTTTTKPRRPVTAKLDRTCVRKGANGDEQGLTVNTDPGDTVAYSTEYSDRSNELSNPSYKTGSGYGEANTDGVYRATWKLPDNAPDGEATIHFIAQGEIQQLKLKFGVVGPLGPCP